MGEKEAAKIRAKEAILREKERQEKVAEMKKKTDAIIKQQEDMAEASRRRIAEREQRMKIQVAEKRKKKQQEILISQQKAAKRIQDALEKNKEIQEMKKRKFDEKQAKAAELAL